MRCDFLIEGQFVLPSSATSDVSFSIRPDPHNQRVLFIGIASVCAIMEYLVQA